MLNFMSLVYIIDNASMVYRSAWENPLEFKGLRDTWEALPSSSAWVPSDCDS